MILKVARNGGYGGERLKFARNGGYGEEGLKVFELGVSIFEVRFGGKAHSSEFLWRDSVETRAMKVRFAVFYFGEIDFVIFGRNNVDFIEKSFVIPSYNVVAVIC